MWYFFIVKYLKSKMFSASGWIIVVLGLVVVMLTSIAFGGPGSKGGIVLISMWGGVTGIALLFSWSVSRRNPEYILRQANSAMGRQFTSVRRGTSRIGNSVRARLGSVRRTQVP